MRVGQDCLYVVYCDGKPFVHFVSKQQALFYLAACSDLYPGSEWSLRTMEVSRDG